MSYRDQSNGPSWLGLMSAVFVGALLAGLLLLATVRAYLHWSVRDTMDQIGKKNAPAATTTNSSVR